MDIVRAERPRGCGPRPPHHRRLHIHLRREGWKIHDPRAAWESLGDQLQVGVWVVVWQTESRRVEAMEVRRERPEDVVAVREVNEKAFAQPAEADLVDSLRGTCSERLSLVAVVEGRVVGHILFTPAVIAREDGETGGMALAPMAVLPEQQRRGIGSRLIEVGLAMLRERSCPFVVLVGHPDYYPRFGFVRASRYGIRCQWDEVPDEAFMVLILDEKVMAGAFGVARYRDEFDPGKQ